jgi:transposase
VFNTSRWILEVVPRKKQQQKGFRVLPKRWLVERTFVWLSSCRRLSRNYKASPETSQAFIYLAMIRLMLKRLA